MGDWEEKQEGRDGRTVGLEVFCLFVSSLQMTVCLGIDRERRDSRKCGVAALLLMLCSCCERSICVFYGRQVGN